MSERMIEGRVDTYSQSVNIRTQMMANERTAYIRFSPLEYNRSQKWDEVVTWTYVTRT